MTQPITNDSFLDLLDELRDELEMISTTNAMNPNAKVDDDIENAVTKCNEIVDTIAADLVARHNTNTSGFTHISKALPSNTLNNTALYVGINKDGFACVFNYLSISGADNNTDYNCYYIIDKERIHQMNGLVWWKILEQATYQDFYEEGFYPKDTPPHYHWQRGWMTAHKLPF